MKISEQKKQEVESRDDFTDVKIHDVEHGHAKLPLFDKNKNYVELKTRDDMPKLFKKVHFEETGHHWKP